MIDTVSTVAVLGLGAMGGRAAARMITAGYQVRGYDPSPIAQQRATGAGVTTCHTADEALEAAEVVVLSLPRPEHVLDTARGALTRAAAGTLVVDLSTIDPTSAAEAARVLQARDVTYLDAPVLGRPERCGNWTLPVGGPADAVERVRALLEASVATRVVRIGEVGAGSVVKLLNNLMFGAINAITAEAFATCRAAGVDPDLFARTIAESGAATVSNLFRELAPKLTAADFSPVFALSLLHKDNRLAVRLIEDLGLPPLLGHSVDVVNTLALRAGYGADDTSAVYHLFSTRDATPTEAEAPAPAAATTSA